LVMQHAECFLEQECKYDFFLTLQIYACVFDWKTVERDDERNRKQPAESVIYA
jgi:hypothetical protein